MTDTSNRTDKATELVDQLHAGVADLITGDDWQHFLDVAARFHRYSFWNTLAIHCQAPNATQVAGYGTWRSLGRQVRSGEHGIRILAPVTYRRNDTGDNDDAGHGPDTEAPVAGPNRVLRGFKVVTVFDIDQTDGPELPAPPARALSGDAPAHLLEDLAGLIRSHGFSFTLGPLPGRHDGANGVTNFLRMAVTVRDDLSSAQQAKTAAHELAHVLLHHLGVPGADRARAELEAESVAYVVLGDAGVKTDVYSFGYLAGWSGGDIDAVQASGQQVITCARWIIDSLAVIAPA